MKKIITSLVLIGNMFVIPGCAKKELVKTEDSMPTPSITNLKSDQVKKEISGIQQHGEPTINKSSANDELNPIPNASELKVGLEKIYFDFDSYVLSSKARATLVKNAELMKIDQLSLALIEGHCDERGSAEYNITLGENRAKSAMKYLIAMGIPEQRLSIISFGKEKPIATGHDEASWTQNRRDEFVISPK